MSLATDDFIVAPTHVNMHSGGLAEDRTGYRLEKVLMRGVALHRGPFHWLKQR